MSTRTKFIVFGLLSVPNMLCAIEATSLATALPIIVADIGGDVVEAFWAGTSFLLASTIVQPTTLCLTKGFGRITFLLIAITLFTVGSIVCGASQSFRVFLVGRCFQGLGSGSISTLTYVIAAELVTLKERGKWFGLIALVWAIGTVIGPIFGGALADKSRWKWTFWMNIPFCIFSLIAIPFCLTPIKSNKAILQRLQEVDWLGSLLLTGAMTSFLVGITLGGAVVAWSEWQVIFPIVLGNISSIAMMVWFSFKPSLALIDPSRFSTKGLCAVYYGTFVKSFMLGAAIYLSPVYFEGVKGFSPINAGLAAFPWTLTIGPLSVVIGAAIAIKGTCIWSVRGGWLALVAGVFYLIVFKANTTTLSWVLIGLLSGMGLGFLFPGLSYSIQASTSPEHRVEAAGLYSFFRALGQTFGVAVSSTIFQKILIQRLSNSTKLRQSAHDIGRNAIAMIPTLAKNGTTEVGKELISHYLHSLSTMWVINSAFAATGLLACYFIKDHTLESREEDLDT